MYWQHPRLLLDVYFSAFHHLFQIINPSVSSTTQGHGGARHPRRHPRWRANPTNRLHIHTLGVHMSLDWGRNPEERGGHANSTHAWRRPWRSEATVLTTKSPCPLISHQSCFGYIVLQSTAKKQKILQDASRVPI